MARSAAVVFEQHSRMASAPSTGWTVAGKEQVGPQRGDRLQRVGPAFRVAQHLLGVAAVGQHALPEITAAHDAALRRPHPTGVVGLAHGREDLEALPADVQGEAVFVGDVGPDEVVHLGGPLHEARVDAELHLVDVGVHAARLAIGVEPSD